MFDLIIYTNFTFCQYVQADAWQKVKLCYDLSKKTLESNYVLMVIIKLFVPVMGPHHPHYVKKKKHTKNKLSSIFKKTLQEKLIHLCPNALPISTKQGKNY